MVANSYEIGNAELESIFGLKLALLPFDFP